MKILVVRIGRMGDMLLVLPALLHIRECYPKAQIDMITSEDGCRVVGQTSVNVSNYLVYDNRLSHRFLSSLKVKRMLDNNTYDRIYLFENKKRYKDLFSNLSQSLVICDESNLEHVSDFRLDSLGASPESRLALRSKCLLNIDINSVDKLKQELSDFDITDENLVIAFHPSYSGVRKNKKDKAHKVWPINYWANLAKLILQYSKTQHKSIKIIADFLAQEKDIAEQLKRECGDTVTVFVGPPNFKRYIALMNRVDLLVAPNTGSMHLAAALNTRVIALFSGHSNKSCAPYTVEGESFVIDADEHPGEGGVSRIKPADVMPAIKQLIKAAKV